MADAPAAPAAAPSGGGVKGKVENPTTVLILGLVTCGLYPLYWMWLRTKEVNDYLGEQRINPMFVFPGCLCFPVVLYAMFLMLKSLPDMQKKAGVEAKDELVLHLVLFLFISPVGMYLFQQKLNEIWSK
ncbi:MAG TPA: DUF4234 domain-containing protein [Planctomycetota bacterium]|nr:DUF4234 domain-containing protein [Planctomycetota bacterium]